MTYKYLIFDVDDTLLNFRTAYTHGQQAVAAELGVEFSDEFARVDEELSWKYWGEYRLDDTDSPDVQRHYHTYYDAYLKKHFSALGERFGRPVNAERLIRAYYQAVAASREPVEKDTLEVYQSLSKVYKMVVATNGLSKVQRSRLQEFAPATSEVFISEEMGVVKPAPAFFEQVIARLRCRPEDCLMIGDSLSNDIKGAKNAGMAACWYNAKQRERPGDMQADYIVKSMGELRHFL